MKTTEAIKLVNQVRSIHAQQNWGYKEPSALIILSWSKLEKLIEYIEHRYHPVNETELFYLVCDVFQTEDNLTQLKYFEAVRLFRSMF